MSRNSPVFTTKRGYLTKYAHACGYIDTAAVGNDSRAIQLFLDGCYHVQCHVSKSNAVWDTFDSDGAGRIAAQKRFRQLVREHQAQRKVNKP